jgi:hypothetical protein
MQTKALLTVMGLGLAGLALAMWEGIKTLLRGHS